jgi:hypothetical protein
MVAEVGGNSILENAIYRIAQEGLANARQHSKSEKVRVSLLQREDRIRIEVRDWRIGFDAKAVEENRNLSSSKDFLWAVSRPSFNPEPTATAIAGQGKMPAVNPSTAEALAVGAGLNEALRR